MLEAAHHVRDGIDLADVREELVAEPFALRRARHESRDVHELDRSGNDLLRMHDVRELLQARIGDRHHTNVRIDGAEREIRRRDARLGQRVEERGLADIGQADDAALDGHSKISTPSSRRKLHAVIPAQAGIHLPLDAGKSKWIPACAGMTSKANQSESRVPSPESRLVCNRFVASLNPPTTMSGSTSSARVIASSIASSSAAEGLPSTHGVTRLRSPGWPMPMRRRWNFPCPSCAIMSRMPFWPPWPPSNFKRAVPGGRSRSSCTTSNSSGASFQ